MNPRESRPTQPRAPQPPVGGHKTPDQPRLRTLTIGTAGHVDHGKSALVHALTGIQMDRLPDEQKLERTIALNFAPLRLPSGRLLNIVDVPGHDAYVREMAKGAQGMDVVLLCIASNERVMPQTREHLDILHLLGIHRGLIVLTKADLLESTDERLLTEGTIRTDLRGTVLQDAPFVWTSGRTREGLGVLLDTLDTLIAELSPRDDAAPVRMPVDRAFVIKGFGTVVTGTLLQGTLRPNQQLVLLPQGTEVRVRGLQIQKEDVPEAVAGERPAVNLAGVDAADIPAGSTLADPRAFDTTTRFLAELTLLARARPIERRTELEFLGGTALSQGRARVHVPGRTLKPGETATAEVLCRAPLVLVHGDLVLVRDVATNATVGRARVLDPHPPAEIALQAAAGIQQAPTRVDAAARIVEAAGATGVPDRELARRIGATPDGLTALVRSRRAYWTQDALTEAREALIKAIPSPGGHIQITTWWTASPIRDEKILRNLTGQLVNLFRLRLEGETLITPRPEMRPLRRRSRASAGPTRPVRLGPLLVARVEHYLRCNKVIAMDDPGPVDGIPHERVRAAIASLVASGRLVSLGRRSGHQYVIHPDALARLTSQICSPATHREITIGIGLPRTHTYVILRYLLKTHRLSFKNGQYTALAQRGR